LRAERLKDVVGLHFNVTDGVPLTAADVAYTFNRDIHGDMVADRRFDFARDLQLSLAVADARHGRHGEGDGYDGHLGLAGDVDLAAGAVDGRRAHRGHAGRQGFCHRVPAHRGGCLADLATEGDRQVQRQDDLDLLLVMTVNPGFGGQSFLPEMLPKVRDIRRRVEDRGRSSSGA